MLLLRGGRVLDPITGRDEITDLLIDGGVVRKIEKNIQKPEDCELFELRGKVVSPGLFDGHVHFRDPGYTYKEDMESGARAAAKGGFTSVICMANTNPPVDNPDTLKYVLEKGKKTGIRVMSAANVTKGMKGRELTDMEELRALGATVFTDDGVPVMDEGLLLEAMKKAAELGAVISLHEEDPHLMSQPGVNAGEIARQIGYGGAFSTAESVLVARDCILALHSGARVCIQHISAGDSVEIVRLAKKLGADVHAEATPHHFTLTEEAVLKYGTMARMNPPLRTERDRRMIIEGLADGTIDMIASDHAPHSAEEKAKPMAAAPSGITGLETSLGLGLLSLVEKGHISLPELLRLMSSNPAEVYGLEPASIKEGLPADLVVFDPDETYEAGDFASKASNTPFTGWSLPGKAELTICGGEIVYRGN